MRWQPAQFMTTMRGVLAPSQTAVGPNVYLSQRDFLRMMGVALFVHVVVFVVASLFPDEKVINIPVRALTFKLGDQDRIAAYSPSSAPAPTAIAAPVMSASSDARVAPSTPTPPKPVKPAKIEPTVKPHVQRQQPSQQPQLAPLPTPQPAPAPAIAPTPQQYVREVGQPAPQAAAQQVQPVAGSPDGAIGGAGTQNTQTEKTSREIRDRYEQQISTWIERHKIYPAEAGGREGRVVVRMRIDRSGVVRYYALEQSSGVTGIDNTALDMIRRANPVPAAPVNYPGGNLVEFLIPITFRAPS